MKIKIIQLFLLFYLLTNNSLLAKDSSKINDLYNLKPFVTRNKPDDFYYNSDEQNNINDDLTEEYSLKGKIIFLDLFECKDMVYKRGIFIWLPEDFSKNNGSYSVVYFHDSQNLFVPSTSIKNLDWKVDELFTKLIKEKKIRQSIIVAIPSSPKRDKELNYFTRDGQAYSNFIINEVIPFIKKNYPVSENRVGHIIAGAGYGGLMSLNIAINNPNIFGGAICLSSIVEKETLETLENIKKMKKIPLNIKLYIDTGELDNSNNSINNIHSNYHKFIHDLIKLGYREEKNLECNYYKNEPNNELYWGKRLEQPLLFMLKK